jgi:hypothetical protein
VSRLRAALRWIFLAGAAALLGAPGAAAAAPALPAPLAAALPAPLGLPGVAPVLEGGGPSPPQTDFPSRALELHFRNRDGYRITAAGFGQTVLLAVSKGRLPSTTVYLAHGKVGANSIRAQFADLGRIAVRFRPSGRVRRRAGGCRRRIAARFGAFVGELSFSGEGGYTSAHVHRAKGVLLTPPARTICRRAGHRHRHASASAAGRGAAGPRAEEKATFFLADWKQPLARTSFAAATLDFFGPHITLFIGISQASEGSIAVVREALAVAPPSSFVVDDALSSAGVSPPPPFSGSGSFQHNADGTTSWTGSLAASFPGAPDVPLTGSQFTTRLEREW